MLTKLLVIQKIEENGEVNIFQTRSDYFQWAFESKIARTDLSPEYFPFNVIGDAEVSRRKPGPETETVSKDNQILFSDDYGVPEGTVIGILFPKNYILDVLKFKEQPYIPVGLNGQVVARPPGQMQIFYNQIEKQSAILLHIQERMVFGIKCLAKKIPDEIFPKNNHWTFDDFDVTISRELLDVEIIQTKDLQIINDVIGNVDIEDINRTLNEILSALKNGDKSKAKSKIGKLGESLSNGLAVTSNMTKLVDSYNVGGAVHQFIAQILKYLQI